MKTFKSIVKMSLPLIAAFLMAYGAQAQTCSPSLEYGWGSVTVTIDNSTYPAYVKVNGYSSGSSVYVLYSTANTGYRDACRVSSDGYLLAPGGYNRFALYSDIVSIHVAENSYNSSWLWQYRLNWY